MPDFAELFAQGQAVMGLFDNARDALNRHRQNVAGVKTAVSTDELSQLEEQLRSIHAKNMELSADLDDTMAQLQARG